MISQNNLASFSKYDFVKITFKMDCEWARARTFTSCTLKRSRLVPHHHHNPTKFPIYLYDKRLTQNMWWFPIQQFICLMTSFVPIAITALQHIAVALWLSDFPFWVTRNEDNTQFWDPRNGLNTQFEVPTITRNIHSFAFLGHCPFTKSNFLF